MATRISRADLCTRISYAGNEELILHFAALYRRLRTAMVTREPERVKNARVPADLGRIIDT